MDVRRLTLTGMDGVESDEVLADKIITNYCEIICIGFPKVIELIDRF